MHEKTTRNKRQLTEELISAWRREDNVRDACKELVHSMPARVAALNNAKLLYKILNTHYVLFCCVIVLFVS